MSSILRIVVGLAILVLTFSTYRKTFGGMQEGGKVLIGGIETSASSGLLTAGFVLIGLIGALILILGIISFFKTSK